MLIKNGYTTYLGLMRLMFFIKMPIKNGMSFKEFEVYAKKVRDKEASYKNRLINE